MDQNQIDATIKRMLDNNLTYKYIERALHVSPRRIAQIKKGVTPNHIRGTKGKLTSEIKAYIELLSILDSTIHDEQMADIVLKKYGIKFHRTTIARVRNKAGLRNAHTDEIQETNVEQK